MKLLVFTFNNHLINIVRLPEVNDEFKNHFYRKIPDEGNEYYNSKEKNTIIYISDKGEFVFGIFDVIKADEASILIFVDESDFNYCPKESFCILRHSNSPVMEKTLVKCAKYAGTIEQKEEMIYKGKESLYNLLLTKFIGKPNVSYSLFFKNYIKSYCNEKLEAALEFLHGCLVGKPDNLNQLKDFDIQIPCTIGKAKGLNIDTLWKSLSPNPIGDIGTFEALRNGVLEMAGVK